MAFHRTDKSPSNIEEDQLFAELSTLVPSVAQDEENKIHVSILRLVVAYLKSQRILAKVLRSDKEARGSVFNFNGRPKMSNFQDFSRPFNNKEDFHAMNSASPNEYANMISNTGSPYTVPVVKSEGPNIEPQRQEHFQRNLSKNAGHVPFNPKDIAHNKERGYVEKGWPVQDSMESAAPPMRNVDWQSREQSDVKWWKEDGKQCGLTTHQGHSGDFSKIFHGNLGLGFKAEDIGLPSIDYEGNLMLEAAGGFLIMLDKDLSIVSTSENISQYLGYTQGHVIGQYIHAFLLPKDISTLHKVINESGLETGLNSDALKKTFYMDLPYRFQRGNRDLTGTSLFQWNVRVLYCPDPATGAMRFEGMVCLCCQVNTNSILFVHNDGNVIYVKMTLDFVVIELGSSFESLTGMSRDAVMNTHAYSLKHPYDIHVAHQFHQTLLTKGQAKSGYHRCISPNHGAVWVFSTMEVVRDRRPNRRSYVDIFCYIVSVKEAEKALCQDEEEYKRFKCEGFGRFYYLKKQKRLSHQSPSDYFQTKLPPMSQKAFEAVSGTGEFVSVSNDLMPCTTNSDGSSSATEEVSKNSRLKRRRISHSNQSEIICKPEPVKGSYQVAKGQVSQNTTWGHGSPVIKTEYPHCERSGLDIKYLRGSSDFDPHLCSHSVPTHQLSMTYANRNLFLRQRVFGDLFPTVEEILPPINIDSSKLKTMDVSHMGFIDNDAGDTKGSLTSSAGLLGSCQNLQESLNRDFDNYIPKLSAHDVDQTINNLETFGSRGLHTTNNEVAFYKGENTNSLVYDSSYDPPKHTIPIYSVKPAEKCTHGCGRCVRPLTFLGHLLEEDDV